MSKIQIWMEGYAATGESGVAHMIGEYEANSFDEAVGMYIQEKGDQYGPERYTRSSFSTEDAFKNRRSDWKIWGCALFDNEADARKAFG